MKKQSYASPPKPMAIETRVIFSMLYQVKDRIEFKKWMKPQDIFEANRTLFEKMGDAAKRDYGLGTTPITYIRAIEILMGGMLPDEFL